MGGGVYRPPCQCPRWQRFFLGCSGYTKRTPNGARTEPEWTLNVTRTNTERTPNEARTDSKQTISAGACLWEPLLLDLFGGIASAAKREQMPRNLTRYLLLSRCIWQCCVCRCQLSCEMGLLPSKKVITSLSRRTAASSGGAVASLGSGGCCGIGWRLRPWLREKILRIFDICIFGCFRMF